MGQGSSVPPPRKPDENGPALYDPMKGFEGGRKERVMHATEAQMSNMKVPLNKRDYCAHKYIELKTCIAYNSPCSWRCLHYRHELDLCYYEDEKIRMKEFERERRLMERQARKERRARRAAEREAKEAIEA